MKGMQVVLSQKSKNRLMSYADSFQSLADIYTKCIQEEEKSIGDLTNRIEVRKAEDGWDRRTYIYQRKMCENQELLAEHLLEIAQVIKKAAKESLVYEPLGARKYKQIYQAFKSEKIIIQDIYFIKNPSNRIELGISMSTKKEGGILTKEVADMLSVLFDVRLFSTRENLFLVDDKVRSFHFMEESKYISLSGVARAIKEFEVISGDNYTIIDNEEGYIRAIISDGMGSGEKASFDSQIVVELLEKFLEAGFGRENAIGLVNSSLVLRGEEQNMSTLDMCELDLYTGMCHLTKVGAASTFLKRGHMVKPITSHNLPLGIFSKLEAESSSHQLADGDYIIMMTDGVIDGVRQTMGEDTITEIISQIDYTNPGEIANTILNTVLHITNGKIRDDMTVIVLGIWENQ